METINGTQVPSPRSATTTPLLLSLSFAHLPRHSFPSHHSYPRVSPRRCNCSPCPRPHPPHSKLQPARASLTVSLHAFPRLPLPPFNATNISLLQGHTFRQVCLLAQEQDTRVSCVMCSDASSPTCATISLLCKNLTSFKLCLICDKM